MDHKPLTRRSFLRSSGAVTASSILACGVVREQAMAYIPKNPPTSVPKGATVTIPAGNNPSSVDIKVRYRIVWTKKDGTTSTEGPYEFTIPAKGKYDGTTITNGTAVSGSVEYLPSN